MSENTSHEHELIQQFTHLHFPLPVIRVLKIALNAFEDALLKMEEPDPRETVMRGLIARMRGKLNDLLQWEDWDRGMRFDFYEVRVFHAAVHLYLTDLIFARRVDTLAECILLCKRFAQIVQECKQVDVKLAPKDEIE